MTMNSIQSTTAGMRSAIAATHQDCVHPAVAKSRIHYDCTPILGTASALFHGNVRRVILHGFSGCGKSSAAALLIGQLADVVEQHYAHHTRDARGNVAAWWNNSVMWIEATDLTEESDNQLRGAGEGLLFSKARAAKVLVLDGLGVERSRFGDAYSITVMLLRHRLRDTTKITIVGTPISSVDIEEKYGFEFRRKLTDPNDPACVRIGPPRAPSSETTR